MNRTALALSLGFGCACVCVVPVRGGDVIYHAFSPAFSPTYWWSMTDNHLGETDSAIEFAGGLENERQAGQLVTFAGTSRLVTTFETAAFFPLSTTPNREMGITLTFYATDGGLPGEVIWSGHQVVTAAATHEQSVSVSFAPNVIVPDSMIFAFEFDRISGQGSWWAPGVRLTGDLPTVGAAGERLLVQDSTTLQWAPDTWSSPNQYFLQARIVAEPGLPACYANCDNSTTPPVLNVADFSCFLQKFAAGDPYANCDESTTPPVLNVADFSCFLQQFAAGCR